MKRHPLESLPVIAETNISTLRATDTRIRNEADEGASNEDDHPLPAVHRAALRSPDWRGTSQPALGLGLGAILATSGSAHELPIESRTALAGQWIARAISPPPDSADPHDCRDPG